MKLTMESFFKLVSVASTIGVTIIFLYLLLAR